MVFTVLQVATYIGPKQCDSDPHLVPGGVARLVALLHKVPTQGVFDTGLGTLDNICRYGTSYDMGPVGEMTASSFYTYSCEMLFHLS